MTYLSHRARFALSIMVLVAALALILWAIAAAKAEPIAPGAVHVIDGDIIEAAAGWQIPCIS